MMRTRRTIVLLFIAGGLFACNTKSEAGSEVLTETSAVSATPQSRPLTIKDEALNAIYPHYVKLTEALVDGKAGEAKIIASTIERGAVEVKQGAALQKFAGQMLSAPTLEKQRAAFSKLSNEFIVLVKKAGVKNGELYTAFCPMANHNEGATWLSWSKDIRNPYFGKEMLSCGTVEETINEQTGKGAM